MTFFPAFTAIAVLLLLAGSSASAHDLWITTVADGDQWRAVLNFGHPTERELPQLDRILDIRLISSKGTTSLRRGKFDEQQMSGAPVLVSPRFAAPPADSLIATQYDNGYWVKTPDGSRNVSTRLFPQAEASLWAVKFSKTLLGPGAYATVVGHELELMPVEDPFGLRQGQSMHVRVQFHGAPVANTDVELGDGLSPIKDEDTPRYRTDAEGVAQIPVDRRGPYLLTVDYRIPGRDPALAAIDYYNAALAFVLQ